MNRNTMTKFVAPMNVIDDQKVLKHSISYLPAQQLSLISTNSSCHSGSSSATTNSLNSTGPLENLPKKFVSNMRTLFDIMDDKRTGFVRLSDIEARWRDDGSKGLPHGVIDCLRRVTPVSGMLSFERFCAGLKICLLRNQANDCNMSRRSSTDSNNNTNNDTSDANQTFNNDFNNNHNPNNLSKASSREDSESHDDKNSKTNKKINANGTARGNKLAITVANGDVNKPSRILSRSSLPVQRTLSLPKLSPSSDGESSSEPYLMPIIPSPNAPPKPPRSALLLNNGSSNHLDSKERCDKAEIRNALQNWQMNVLMNEWEAKDKRRAMAIPNTSFINRGAADGSPSSLAGQPFQPCQLPHNAKTQQPTIYNTNRSPTLLEFQKKTNRRREIRRHTLQNGIDYNMLKRIRHYEQQKDLLLDGLNAVEKAQEWYFKQIAFIQERVKCLGRGDGHMEQWTEAYEERLDLQRAQIMEVNRHLASLEESWERGGMLMHINLAVRNNQYNSNGLPQFHDAQVNQLKVQNRQLTEEVGQKSERIADLEMERKSLYRELLQHQQQSEQMQQQLLRKQGHILCANEEVIF